MNRIYELILTDVPIIFALIFCIGCAFALYYLLKYRKRCIELEKEKIESEIGKVYSQEITYDWLRDKYERYKRIKGKDDQFVENAVSGLERRISAAKTLEEASKFFEGFRNCHAWGNVFDKLHKKLASQSTKVINKIGGEDLELMSQGLSNAKEIYENVLKFQALTRSDFFTIYFNLNESFHYRVDYILREKEKTIEKSSKSATNQLN